MSQLKNFVLFLKEIQRTNTDLCSLKGSYDAILKIIILCIWCNRIHWHALMLIKHIIFQILYIIVVHLCPVSLLWLSNWPSALWLAEHHKHNRELQLSSYFYQFKPEKGNRVAWQTQWWCLYVFCSTQAAVKMIIYAQNSAFEQSIANTWTNNKTYLQLLIQKRQIVIAKSELTLFKFFFRNSLHA